MNYCSKELWGKTPRPPLNKTLFRSYYTHKYWKKSLSKHSSNLIAILRASSLQYVMQNIENHDLPPLLNPRTNPPPPFFSFFFPFQKFVAVENKYSVLGLPGNKFPGPSTWWKNIICPDQKCQPPPPSSESNGRPLSVPTSLPFFVKLTWNFVFLFVLT